MTDVAMKPQETVIYLLGELKGQFVSLQGSVDSAQTTQATINATTQAKLDSIDLRINTLNSDVHVLQSQQAPRAPWWSVAAGIASIAAVATVVIQIFTR